VINRSIFKAYDVRGLYPQEVNEEAIRAIGQALAEILPEGEVVIAHDGRHGSPTLANTISEEIVTTGSKLNKNFKTIFVGLATTPMYYFLVNHFRAVGGAMITASHNPKEYNGVKPVRAGAIRVSSEELLAYLDKHGL
jgi:phosphomannomutase